MAKTPKWKVYRNGEYVAACKDAEDAAVLVSAWSGGVVKYDHQDVVWTEGAEEFSAGESYDRAAKVMHDRREKAYAEAKARFDARSIKVEAELRQPKTAFIIPNR